jgi:PST family polysaccharide transporter
MADAAWLKFLPALLRSRMVGRHGLQTVIGNSGWLLLDRALRAAVGLIVGVWLARYLGPNQYGQLNFAIAFVALFTPLATLGLDGIVVRDLVRTPDQRGVIVGSALSLKLIGGVAALIFVQAAMWQLRPADAGMRWMVGIIATGLIFQSLDAFDFWFQSLVRSRLTVYAKGAAFLVFAGIKMLLIFSRAELLAFAWATAAEVVLGAVLLALAYARASRENANRPLVLWSWRKMRELLAESWPLLLSGLAVMVYLRIDQVMLAQYRNDREVGIYSAALRLSELWYAIPTILVTSVTPSLVEAHRASNLYYERLQQLFGTLTRSAYLVAIPVTLVSSQIVYLVYGEQFAAAGPILAIHIWTGLFVFLGVALGPWIINEGLTKFFLAQTLAGAAANVALNVFLIPRFGGVGAASATLVSQMVAAHLALCVFKRTRRIFIMQTKAILLRT